MMTHPLYRMRTMVTAALLALVLITFSTCESSDPVAPSGSTLILSANPADLPEGGTARSTITALLLDPSGAPLRENQMFFTSDDGSLFQVGSIVAESPIVALTDDNGVARVEFTTSVGTTVRGQSGSAIDEVTITVGGQQVVDVVELTAITPGADQVGSGTTVMFQVKVRDDRGILIAGKQVDFRIDPITGGTVTPTSAFTNEFGEATFDVENITEDIDVEAQADSVLSNSFMITVVVP